MVSVLAACGGTTPADASNSNDASDAQAVAKPACDEIAARCHPYDEAGGTPQTCHRFAEDPASSNAACMSMQASCFAACPLVTDGGTDSGTSVSDASASDSATEVHDH